MPVSTRCPSFFRQLTKCSYSGRASSGRAAVSKPGRLPRLVSPARVNWEITKNCRLYRRRTNSFYRRRLQKYADSPPSWPDIRLEPPCRLLNADKQQQSLSDFSGNFLFRFHRSPFNPLNQYFHDLYIPVYYQCGYFIEIIFKIN